MPSLRLVLILAGLLLWAVVWMSRRLKASQDPKQAKDDETLAAVKQVAEQYNATGNDSFLARRLATAAALPELVGLSSRQLAKKLADADVYLRRPIVEQLAERADATAFDAIAGHVAYETNSDTKAVMLLALTKAGRSFDIGLWMDVLRDEKSEARFKLDAVRELASKNVRDVVPHMFQVVDAALTKGSSSSGPLVLEVTHAALQLDAHDALRKRANGAWVKRYIESASEQLRASKSRSTVDALAQNARAFLALLTEKTGASKGAAQQLDWMLQEHELRRMFPDYERERTAAPNVVADTIARVRFRTEQALRWDATPEGALALDVGWHDASASLDFETRSSEADGVDLPRLRLSMTASDGEYELSAVLDTWNLLELALAPSTPRAFLLRCPEAWRSALRSELRLTNAKGLNDSRERVDFTIERTDIKVFLKYQGPRFDFALLPAEREPVAQGDAHGADETRLLLVVRGVTADVKATDDVVELPAFVCALRFEALLASLEVKEREDENGERSEPPNPRVRRSPPRA